MNPSIRPESSLRRAFAERGLEPQLAMTARDAELIKTYVRAGIGVGLLAEMAVSAIQDADLSRAAGAGLDSRMHRMGGPAARTRAARLHRRIAGCVGAAARSP